MADKSVAVRLSVKDAELVRATLERLGRDGEAAIKRMDRAARDSDVGFNKIGAAVTRLEGNVARLTALAGVGSFSGIVALGRNAIETAGGLGELAEQLGLNTDQLQVYQYVATQTGVRSEELGTGFAKLTRLIGEAKDGNNAALETFDRLGIKILDAAGRTRSAGSIFEEAADIIAAMPDDAQRATAAFDLLGKTGQKMVPALSGGTAALQRYADEARAAGLVWTPDMIARADQVADQLAALEMQAAKLAQTLALDGGLISGMQAVVDFINGKAIQGEGMLAGMLRSTREELQALEKAAQWLGLADRDPAVQLDRDIQKKLADLRHRYIAGGGANGQFSERFMRDLRETEQRAALVDYDRDEAAARDGRLPASVPTAGVSNPRAQASIDTQRKAEEQIRKTTDALAAQGDQFARTAEQRAVYDAMAQAGIKTSDAEIKSARELLATYPEFATERDKAIVQIADLAASNHRKAEAEKAGADAVREHEREQKRLTETQKKASEGVDEILAGLREEQTQLRLSERDRFIRQKSLEAERKLLEAGLPLQDARIDRIREEAGATYDLNKAVDEAKRAREEFEREAEKQAEAQRELLLEPYREAWRSVQQMGADAITSMFDGSLKSAKDYWKEFKNIALRTLAQIASAEITVAVQGAFSTSGAPGGQGGISGIIGQIFGGGSSPVAGTANLPTSGGGGLSGLFGGGSIGSFLSKPLHSIGIGSPGLDPTGASAYLGLAESGGIGGMLGGLSIGQGLGAIGGFASGIMQLTQGGTANTIGGITSLIGAGVSLIPGVGQILGPIISIAGPLLGGIFGKKKPKIPVKQAQLYTGAPGIATSGASTLFQGTDFYETTPFGVLGYYGTGTNKRFDDPEGDAGTLLRAVADMDRAIAELLTQSEIDKVAAALQGRPGVGVEWKKAFDNEGFDIVKDRLDATLRTLYGNNVATKGLDGIARSNDNIDELIDRAGEVIQVANAIKGLGIVSTDAEQAIKAINEQFDELSKKAKEYGFSAAEVAKIEAERRRTASQVAGDFNKGVADQLLGFADPYALAQQQLAESQDTRRKEALYLKEQYEKGLIDTLVDINKLEDLFGKERVRLSQQALDAIGADWKSFRDELLFGPLSAKSNREQYELAIGEYQDVRARAQSAFAANDNLDPALAAEFQKEALLALQWSRTYNASSAATAQLYQQILDLARQFGDLDIPGFAGGGVAGPGLIEVGERGREFIRLFQPARIYSNAESNAMAGMGGGNGLERLTEMFDFLGQLLVGNQSQMMQRLGQLIEQFIAARRDAELRGATQAASNANAAAPLGPVGVPRNAAGRAAR